MAMGRFCGWIVLLFTIHLSLGYAKDLYALLGLKKTATSKEIKKAYREKARQTHPDKNKGENVEETTAQFREIVDAFETLSDKAAREHYDRTGASMNQQKKGRNNEHNSNWNWGFNFNFQHQQQNPKYHHFLYDPYRKHQILDAQSRTINIRPTLDHLFSVIHTDEDNPVVERYILLAFFDSSQQQCADLLRYQVLYPWPFAGYTQEGSGGMWWEEIVMTLKVDLNPETTVADDAQRLMEHFGLAFGKGGRMLPEQCPSFSVITRGDSGLNRQSTKHLSDTESFRSWVWQQLKMSVTIVNRTPWVVHSWWVDGHRGVRKDNLEVGARYPISTFISHTFFFRADFVEGNALTNESALMWYQAKIQDDNTEVSIYPRCFDHSGECVRWRREGGLDCFCGNDQTFYTMQNPGFRKYVKENCFVTCKVGCGAEARDEL